MGAGWRGGGAGRWAAGAAAVAGVLLAAPGLRAQPAGLVASRNIFPAGTPRPDRSLAGGGTLTLSAERVRIEGATGLRITAPSPDDAAALRFQPLAGPEGGWRLTLYLTTRHKERDFYYLSQGQRAEGGRLVEQKDYRAEGLETALSAADAEGRPREVRELVIQDDGQSELRLTLDGGTLRLALIPPEKGGTLSPPRFAGGQGPPLRFLDYNFFGSVETDNGLGELWIGDVVVLRGNVLTGSSTSRYAVRAALAQQVWRSEHFSAWVEGGLGVMQKRNEKTKVTGDAAVGLAPGVTGHWRWRDFGAALHFGGAGGPAIAELLGGWQFSQRWGLVAHWQQIKDVSGYGLGVSVNW